MRIALSVLVVAVAIGPGAAFAEQTSPPKGSVGIRLLQAPSSLRNDPRAHLYIIDHVSQAATISRQIEISSGLDHDARVRLYAAGASVHDGNFQFFEGHEQNELSGWTSVSPSSVQLPAHGTARATATIAVPSGATRGERYGVVWAELPPVDSSSGVDQINRVGIRMYLSVGQGSDPPSDFTIDSLTAARDAANRPEVTAAVHNVGKRALDMSGELRLTNGPGGLSAGPFAVKLGTTLGIGETEPVLVVLDPSIPNGPWDARLVLRSGLITRAASGRITFPATPAQSSDPVRVQTTKVTPADTPFGRALLGGAAALIIAVLAAAAWHLRRRKARAASIRQRA